MATRKESLNSILDQLSGKRFMMGERCGKLIQIGPSQEPKTSFRLFLLGFSMPKNHTLQVN